MNEILSIVFNCECYKGEIKGSSSQCDSWRLKERMKTVSVALVLCFNIGVDPPDIIKTQPCARFECWTDPYSMNPQKAIEVIANKLQKQYERFQPRARYKHSLDPTIDDIKKLCISLRRNAKEERVLFHYNGHGVPRPTCNGEIWVFNKSYTQYIPLSIYDLQSWLGAPSIYVYDCSNAGIIIETFNQFAEQQIKEMQEVNFKNCIQMAACSVNQILPMNPELPADLFTSCLTTPIDTALKWFMLQNHGRLLKSITKEMIEKIPGLYNDRRTMLGELNWIFTAVTDTIAWNSFSRGKDLLVASLFRNFLLAERIMRSYDCCPISSPFLPPTYQHPMWQAWDYAVDKCLSQLPKLFNSESTYETSHFFADQLTAFKIWLKYGNHISNSPEQLPIVLQVLLSQVHRVMALQLLGEFLDLGEWAVNLALSVGVFPYVLKLLQSSADELKPLLVFIWAKILAADNSCCIDLIRDECHKYFLSILADGLLSAEYRTMAAFVLSCIASNHQSGQDACLKGNMISICLEQLNDSSPLLRRWLALCLGKVWKKYDDARWCGVRDVAHEKLYILLNDPVRASAVFALGTFINASSNRSDHSNTINHSIGNALASSIKQEASPLVRKVDKINLSASTTIKRINSTSRLKQQSLSFASIDNSSQFLFSSILESPMKRVSSSSSLSNCGCSMTNYTFNTPFNNIYLKIWQVVLVLQQDPYSEVREKADVIINSIKSKSIDTEPIQSSNFVHQSSAYFLRPNLNYNNLDDYESIEHITKQLKLRKHENIKAEALVEQERMRNDKLESQIFFKHNASVPNVLKIHPFEPYIYVADKNRLSIWNFEDYAQEIVWENHTVQNVQISSLELINAHDDALILVASDDGNIRVWNNNMNENRKPQLITAWMATDELKSQVKGQRGCGLLVSWSQYSHLLLTAGKPNCISIWDLQKEMKISDYPIGANCCTTAITYQQKQPSIFAIGCADGSVRLFDSRICPSSACIMTWRELQSWIVEIFVTSDIPGRLLAGSINGNVMVCELRKQKSLLIWETSQEITAMASHPEAEIFACGSVNQFITTYNLIGEELSLIKYDGFMGQKIGPVSCLAFHPYRILLAAGSSDCYISLYALNTKRQ